MKTPTRKQQKELWEWSGFTCEGKNRWIYPGIGGTRYNAPSTDLNNLFAYSVPLAIDKIMATQECSSDVAYAILFKKWLEKLQLDIPNYKGTLFQAIWEVMKDV